MGTPVKVKLEELNPPYVGLDPGAEMSEYVTPPSVLTCQRYVMLEPMAVMAKDVLSVGQTKTFDGWTEIIGAEPDSWNSKVLLPLLSFGVVYPFPTPPLVTTPVEGSTVNCADRELKVVNNPRQAISLILKKSVFIGVFTRIVYPYHIPDKKRLIEP